MRKDQKFSESFQKDDRFEFVLKLMNQQLSEEQSRLFEDKGNLFPTVHVIGVPRSGTTLVTQLLLSFLSVGYINNLIAAFWQAPLFGIELSKKLLGTHYTSNFQSNYGRTNSIMEPHEFGYFWNSILKYSDFQQHGMEKEKEIDWEYLALLLNNFTYRFNAPVIFKSFLLGFHAKKIYSVSPKVVFIYIKRDFLSNAFSILNLRKKLNGDIKEWGSIKPIQYPELRNLSIYEQIAGQILLLEHEYLKQLQRLPEENILLVEYQDICRNPSNFIGEVADLIKKHSHIEQFPLNQLPNFSINDIVIDNEESNRFMEARAEIEKRFPYLIKWK